MSTIGFSVALVGREVDVIATMGLRDLNDNLDSSLSRQLEWRREPTVALCWLGILE